MGLAFVDPNSWVEDDFVGDGVHLNGRDILGTYMLGLADWRVVDRRRA